MIKFNNHRIKIIFVSIIGIFILYSCAPNQPPQPCENVTDIDGNTYNVVKIGTQCWMAENLKVTRYRNGDSILKITNDTTWIGLVTGAYCDYNNDTANSTIYGRLYNWYAVSDSRGIAPVGWHIPTDAEWATLENYLGGSNVAYKMKVPASNIPPWDGVNASGFAALPSGERFYGNGHFYDIDTNAIFWSTTEYSSLAGWDMFLDLGDMQSHRGFSYKAEGISLRCIKD